MSQHLVELCATLVEESFGDTAALIWSHLAEHGRTQFPELLARSGVSAKQLGQVLPILILNRAVVYYIDPEYDSTWYSINLDGTYNLLRYTKLGDLVKERCGKDAALVILNLAQLGHISVGELVDSYGFNDMKHGQRTPRDVTNIKTVEQLFAALTKLIRAGFLIKANPRFFQTEFDVQHNVEKQIQEAHFTDGRITGPKASLAFVQKVNEHKRKQRESDLVVDGIIGPNDDYSVSNKRQKTGMTNGKHHLESDMILSINMKKYLVALRSKSYARMATTYLGQSSGAVYDAFLLTLEKQVHDVTDGKDEGSDSFMARATASDIYDVVDPSIDLTTSIKVSSKDLPNGHNNSKAARFVQVQEDFSGIGIKQEHDSDDDRAELTTFQNRSKLMEMIERHLQSIAEHPKCFCRRDGQGKPAVWTIDCAVLTQNLILAEIDSSIEARFGKTATRLVRMLRDKGKLEEKQISAYAFLPMKDVRAILSELYAAGYVEAQELAKDQTRQPAKALYLWYFDPDKVQRMIIHQCYQSMARLYQRLATEREKYKSVINKAYSLTEAHFFGENYYKPQQDEDDGENNEQHDVVSDDGDHMRNGLNGHANKANGVQHMSTTHTVADPDAAGEEEPPVRFVLGATGLWKNDAMSNMEKQNIKDWKDLESIFLGQIMRLDDVIVLLRDFSGQYIMTSA